MHLKWIKVARKMHPRERPKTICKRGIIFNCFLRPLGLPVATCLAILGSFWAPSGPPEISKSSTMFAETRTSKNPLQLRRESGENGQEPAANPPRFCRKPPRTRREPAVRTLDKNSPPTAKAKKVLHSLLDHRREGLE